MKPSIEKLLPKTLVGYSMEMSLLNNKTIELWSRFMPLKNEIPNVVGTDLYSVQVYDSLLDFDPTIRFKKWATIEVSLVRELPNEMEVLQLEGGLYAVFLHKGSAQDFPKTFQYIFMEWLPNSIYELEDRPHFEILGDKYIHNDPKSEEEIWIPIKQK